MKNGAPPSPPEVSHSVASIALSAIKEMAMRSAATPGAVSLAWGLPSFPTPEHIRRRVAAALEDDPAVGMYALPDGLPELRALVAETHAAATGRRVDPAREVVITAGNMQGINALLHTLLDPGDQVIITDPGFASHIQQIRMVGGKPVYLPLDPARGWQIDIEALPRLIGPRTKAIILVSPSNPTGAIFDEAALRQLGAAAREQNVMVILDDPYSHFAYENHERCFNLASLPELAENVAYLFTFSKAYAMSGWRLGYMVLPAALKADVLKVHDATLICAPRVSQVAGIAALAEPPVHLAEFETILGRRRDLICERLARVPHVFDCQKPDGAYYVFPRIVAAHEDSREFSFRLLETAGVAVTPGGAFGPRGEHHVRMAYCVAEDDINAAFDRIERAFPA